MKFSEVFTSKDNIQLDKKTLVILRWIALVGQYLTINIVNFVFKFELPFFYCSLVIFIGVITNFYLQFVFKKNQLNNFTSTFVLFYDLLQLSLLLYLTGGITNPFSILLIVPAIVASTFLNLRSTINLSITTIVILIVLTIYNFPLPHYGELHFHIPDTYLYALPIAIMITLIFLTYFGVRFGIESKKRTEAWDALLKARSIENMCYVAGVNRVGLDGNDHEYSGHSAVYDMLGKQISTAKNDKVVFAETLHLNKTELTKTRKRFAFLNDRDAFTLT